MFERIKKYNEIAEMKDELHYSTRESLKNMFNVYDTASLITKDFSRKQREHLFYAVSKTLSTVEVKEHIMSNVQVLFNEMNTKEMREFFEECLYQYDNRHHLEWSERESA